MQEREYSLYLVRCADGSLYTGIAIDVERRFLEHQCGAGAKYLRGRGPLQLAFHSRVGNRALALRLEHRVKQFDRRAKEALIAGRLGLDELSAATMA